MIKSKDKEELERFKDELDYRYVLTMQIRRVIESSLNAREYITNVETLTDLLLPYIDDEAKKEIEMCDKEFKEEYDSMFMSKDYEWLKPIARKKFRVLIRLMDRKGLLLVGKEAFEKLGI